MDEYLTIAEVADRLKIKPKTVKNKMASGVFRQGVHYFRPRGIKARFKWSAVVAWLEQGERGPEFRNEAMRTSPRHGAQKTRGLDIGGELAVKGQYVR